MISEYSTNSKDMQLDCIYVLRNDEEMYKTGLFEDKNEEVACTEPLRYYKLQDQVYIGQFWGYRNITALDVKCLKFHGMASDLYQNLKPTQYR